MHLWVKVSAHDRPAPSFLLLVASMSKKPEKHFWIDRDGRQRTDSWNPARKSDGLLPLLSLTVPAGEGLTLWEGRRREGGEDLLRPDDDGNRNSDLREQVAAENQDFGLGSPSLNLPAIRDEPGSPGVSQEEGIREIDEEPVRLPSLYYAADDIEGNQEEGRAEKQMLTRLSDRPSAMQQFLDFRQEEKRRRIGAIENGEFPARTAQMLREVFCPATPDPAIKRRNRGEGIAKQTIMLMPHETLLYEHFKTHAHVPPDAHEDLPSRLPSQDAFGGSRWQDGNLEEVEKHAMDLRGFIAFMKESGLIPRQFVQDGNKSALPIQYSLAVQAFKARQSETVARDRGCRFGFPEFKDAIHKFFHRGREILQEQIDQRLQKVEKLELKIARHVPNSPDPISDLKKYFSQLFDTVFDAYIYFDHAGDWKVTMSGFRQQCKKLGLPLTGADLYAALLNKTQMSFLDQYTFLQTFGWYPLIVKPKLQVHLYKVKPIEALLHRMFCLMGDGVQADDALTEVKRVASKTQERLASAQSQDHPRMLRNGSTGSESQEVPLLHASSKNFIGKWKRASERNLDGGGSPLYAVYTTGLSPRAHSPSRSMSPDGNSSPPGAVRRSVSMTGDRSPPAFFHRANLSADGPFKGDASSLLKAESSRSPMPEKLSSTIEEDSSMHAAEHFGEQRRVSEESRYTIFEDEGSFDGGGGFDGTHRGRGRSRAPLTPETNPAIDSADHSLTFQTFVEFMKVSGLVPVAEAGKDQDRDGEKGQGAEKEAAGQKTDLGSAEFEVALEIFRETTGKGDRLEWQEFKDCLHSFLRTGLRRLQNRKTEAEAELFKMRVQMSKFAPSFENPLAAFKVIHLFSRACDAL
eukprot:3561663-Rhodomonas_salina.1